MKKKRQPKQKMTTYTVAYTIEVDAINPMEAALEVGQILKDMDYRPYLTVTNVNDKTDIRHIDLETINNK